MTETQRTHFYHERYKKDETGNNLNYRYPEATAFGTRNLVNYEGKYGP